MRLRPPQTPPPPKPGIDWDALDEFMQPFAPPKPKRTPPPASHGRLQYLDKAIHAHIPRVAVPGQTIKDAINPELEALLDEWVTLTGERWVYNQPEQPLTPAGRKRQPSNTPYTKTWPRQRDASQPDILDRIKALVLRFIDWLNGHTGAAEDDKHIADGEHMATLAELFDEVEQVKEYLGDRPGDGCYHKR